MEITPQLLVSLLAPILSVLGLGFVIGRQLSDLTGRLDGMDKRLQALATYTGGLSKEMVQQFALIVQMLRRRGELDEGELSLVLGQQGRMNEAAVDAFLERERAGLNPLNAEQLQRLEQYVHKARRGELFSAEQVQEYNSLVAIVEREQSGDPGVWALAALGAFLLGLAIGSNREQRS